MSYINEIDFDFHVGDSFDLSPIEGLYVASKLLAVGAEYYIDGNVIIVVSLPESYKATESIPAPVEEAPAPAPEPEPTPEPVPVVEVAAPVAEVEASAVPSETPIKRGRKPAAEKVEKLVDAEED